MYAFLTLLAQTTDTTGDTTNNSNPLVSFLPILLLIVVFYFFMIRPQKNRMRHNRNFSPTSGSATRSRRSPASTARSRI